jgi:hypothetical protein
MRRYERVRVDDHVYTGFLCFMRSAQTLLFLSKHAFCKAGTEGDKPTALQDPACRGAYVVGGALSVCMWYWESRSKINLSRDEVYVRLVSSQTY